MVRVYVVAASLALIVGGIVALLLSGAKMAALLSLIPAILAVYILRRAARRARENKPR